MQIRLGLPLDKTHSTCQLRIFVHQAVQIAHGVTYPMPNTAVVDRQASLGVRRGDHKRNRDKCQAPKQK